jgi:hypothetical protein
MTADIPGWVQVVWRACTQPGMSAVMYLFEEPVPSQECQWSSIRACTQPGKSLAGYRLLLMTADFPGRVQALQTNTWPLTFLAGYRLFKQIHDFIWRACTQPGMSAVMYLFEEPVPSQECQLSCICRL